MTLSVKFQNQKSANMAYKVISNDYDGNHCNDVILPVPVDLDHAKTCCPQVIADGQGLGAGLPGVVQTWRS